MLQIEQIQVNYGAAPALWDVTLQVNAGELVSVIGPNGAGKTTLINAVMGLCPLKSGHIAWEGETVSTLPAHRLCERGLALEPESRRLFTGMTVLGCYQFRATRNSDLFVDEEEVTNLRTKLQGELPQRHFGNAVRLEVAENCSSAMTDFLLAQFNLKPVDLYRVNGPVNLVRLMQVPDWVDRPDMKFRPFVPGTPTRCVER